MQLYVFPFDSQNRKLLQPSGISRTDYMNDLFIYEMPVCIHFYPLEKLIITLDFEQAVIHRHAGACQIAIFCLKQSLPLLLL